MLGLKKEIEAFRNTPGLYWHRHRTVRALLPKESAAAQSL